MSLFDQRDLAEISSPDDPGERLVACRNPQLAEERKRFEEEDLASVRTERQAYAERLAMLDEAIQARQFLVRLSGRQMKQGRPVTVPALLAGLFILFTMLETIEHYSLSELKSFAQIAKNQLTL